MQNQNAYVNAFGGSGTVGGARKARRGRRRASGKSRSRSRSRSYSSSSDIDLARIMSGPGSGMPRRGVTRPHNVGDLMSSLSLLKSKEGFMGISPNSALFGSAPLAIPGMSTNVAHLFRGVVANPGMAPTTGNIANDLSNEQFQRNIDASAARASSLGLGTSPQSHQLEANYNKIATD